MSNKYYANEMWVKIPRNNKFHTNFGDSIINLNHWTLTSENVPSDMYARRRFRSDCAFAQSDQNLHWAHFG